MINNKPTVSYAESQMFLTRAAIIVDDRPLKIRNMTEDDLVPITPNQLLVVRISTLLPTYYAEEVEDFNQHCRYQEELLDTWWRQLIIQVFPNMTPYQQ